MSQSVIELQMLPSPPSSICLKQWESFCLNNGLDLIKTTCKELTANIIEECGLVIQFGSFYVCSFWYVLFSYFLKILRYCLCNKKRKPFIPKRVRKSFN